LNGLRAVTGALLVLATAALALAPHGVSQDEVVRPAALSATIAILANTSFVTRGEAVGYTMWLNLSGAGSIASVSVNLTFDGTLTADPANATTPSGCAWLGGWSWQCTGLRSGSHPWSVGATVRSDAVAGRYANVSADVTTFSAGTTASLPTEVASVWVTGVDLTFTEAPASARPGDRILFSIVARNVSPDENDTAYNVNVTIVPGPWLIVDPRDPLTIFVGQLTQNSTAGDTFEAILAGNATVGSRIGIRAVLRYDDVNLRPVGPLERSVSLEVRPSEFVPAESVLVAVAAFALAVVGTVVALLVAGQRRIDIDEVFLVHRSGIMIQHYSPASSLKKDDDLVASMLVAIQDFVEDAFRTEATLDEFSFGRRSAAFVRGRNIVLAAIISRGNGAYMIPQMRAAANALEEAHGPDLAAWDGRLASLGRAREIMDTLLTGGYRTSRFWTGWTRGARAGRSKRDHDELTIRPRASKNVYVREANIDLGTTSPDASGGPSRRAAVRPVRPDTDDLVRERLRANADDVDALFVLSAIHAREGHVVQGLDVLDRVLRIDPKYPGGWVFKAKLHRLQGDPDAEARAERRAEVEQP